MRPATAAAALLATLAAPCALFAQDAAAVPATPLRVLCVGDSITQGGKLDREEYTYRLPLQRLLKAEGLAFDFVGSQRAGLQPGATWPEVVPGVPFDPDHEGYYGNKTAMVVQKVVAAWRDGTPPPDVVLVHLGTNDQGNLPHEETVQKPLRELVAFLRSKNPSVKVFLGHLNFNDSAGGTAIRALVEALAKELGTAASPVVTVHHYRGWVENPASPQTDTFDWAHPNPQGQLKMAQAWLAALRP